MRERGLLIVFSGPSGVGKEQFVLKFLKVITTLNIQCR